VLYVGRQFWIDAEYAEKRGFRELIGNALKSQQFQQARDAEVAQLATAAPIAFALLLEAEDPKSPWTPYIRMCH
jgi:aminopeptidase N